MYQLTHKRRHPLINVVFVVLALSITTEVSRIIFKSPSVDDQLIATSAEVNKRCPFIVDSLTRLDNTVALPNHKLQYNYTFYKSDKAGIDTIALIKNRKETLINKLKTDPKFAVFKQNDVIIAATFYDKAGKYVCALSVTPNEYQRH